jgi:5'(3')-deoxyribonucleotidase
MKPVIYVDVDGVLVDFVGHTYREVFGLDENQAHKAMLTTDGWDRMPAVLTEHLGTQVTDTDLWRRIASYGAAFWEDIPWLPWGEMVMEMVEEINIPSMLLTTPTHYPESAAGKLQWIDKAAPSFSRSYALCPCKHLVARPNALLIDDSEKNVHEFEEHGGQAFLVPQPWNHKRDQYCTKGSWINELEDKINSFLEEYYDKEAGK